MSFWIQPGDILHTINDMSMSESIEKQDVFVIAVPGLSQILPEPKMISITVNIAGSTQIDNDWWVTADPNKSGYYVVERLKLKKPRI